MDLDDIREILYAFTKKLAEHTGSDTLSDEEEVEGLVEEFIADSDLLEDVEEQAEESY